VEVKIGVQYSARELVVESTQTPDEIEALVSSSLAAGTVLSLVDEQGRRVVVPADKVSYVEIAPREQRRVGFGTA
jgi:hypothetical protein